MKFARSQDRFERIQEETSHFKCLQRRFNKPTRTSAYIPLQWRFLELLSKVLQRYPRLTRLEIY
jgi:hypothetical protein